MSRNEHKPWFIGWNSEVPSRRDHGTVVVLSYMDENPHMSTWGGGSLLGQDSHSVINRTLGCLNSQMNMSLDAGTWTGTWELKRDGSLV